MLRFMRITSIQVLVKLTMSFTKSNSKKKSDYACRYDGKYSLEIMDNLEAKLKSKRVEQSCIGTAYMNIILVDLYSKGFWLCFII